eukprot:15346802-Ditylum_brightwellii.AAC.1
MDDHTQHNIQRKQFHHIMQLFHGANITATRVHIAMRITRECEVKKVSQYSFYKPGGNQYWPTLIDHPRCQRRMIPKCQ